MSIYAALKAAKSQPVAAAEKAPGSATEEGAAATATEKPKKASDGKPKTSEASAEAAALHACVLLVSVQLVLRFP